MFSFTSIWAAGFVDQAENKAIITPIMILSQRIVNDFVPTISLSSDWHQQLILYLAYEGEKLWPLFLTNHFDQIL